MDFLEIALSAGLGTACLGIGAIAIRHQLNRQGDASAAWLRNPFKGLWQVAATPQFAKGWRADQLDLALEVAHIGAWIWHIDENRLEWNDQCFRLLGYQPGTVTPSYELWRARLHPDDREWVEASLQTALDQESGYTAEYRIVHPDGSILWWAVRGQAWRNARGEVKQMVGVCFDITDRKQAEASLCQSEAINRQILAAIPDLLLWMKPDGTCLKLSSSDSLADLFPDPANLHGINQYDLLPPDLAKKRKQTVERALASQEIQVYEQQLPFDGEVQDEEVRVIPVAKDRVLVIIRDIRDRKRSEQERQKAERALLESETRYRRVVEAQTDFILRSTADTTITFANQSLCGALGASFEQIVGKQWIDFANADDMQQVVLKGIAQLSPEKPRFFAENRDIRADGQVGWTQWLNEGIFDSQGSLVEIQSVGRDITPLKQAEQAVRDSEERLRLVTENMSDLVCLHHPDGRYLYVTPSSYSLLGYHPEELLGRSPYELFHPDDLQRIRQEAHQRALAKYQVPITYRIRQKTGDYIWLETLTKPILNEVDEVVHLQTTSREVSDRIRIENQLRHETLHDALTGLPNRILLRQRIDLALQQARQQPNFQFAILFLDLDQFKMINDSLGHLIGDQLLRAIAQKLLKLVRESDLVARISGDEFVILLENLDSINEALQAAQRLSTDLKRPIQLGERDIFVTTSIGIAAGSAAYSQPEALVRDADIAMYRAKRSGRAGYAIFDPSMHLQVMQRLHLENDLRQALDRQEFRLYYQPIVALKSLETVGFEVLIRWQHPRFGLMTPDMFVAVAEETGLILSIGAWVLQAACRQLANWRQAEIGAELKISVNLSVRQLQGGIILQQLQQVIQAAQLPESALTLEITESMLVENIEATRQLLSQIQAYGSRISIDDFGTGYSSLSYLHQLPVDALKIDRSFVSPMGRITADAKNQTIAESIVALSNLLGIDAIAEGIETPEQLKWLQTLGCEYGQGYLFSPPVPEAEATALIQRNAFSTLTSKCGS